MFVGPVEIIHRGKSENIVFNCKIKKLFSSKATSISGTNLRDIAAIFNRKVFEGH